MTDARSIIAAAMAAQSVSQTALAARSGVSRANICDYLRGKTDPRISTIERLMAVLGLTIKGSK